MFFRDSDGADKVSECKDYTKKIDIRFSFDYDKYSTYLKNLVSLLRVAETTFDCSGFCSTNNYYVFRDMNDGKPDLNEDCRVEFVDFLSSTIVKSIIITAILVVYLIIISIFSCKVMFTKEKKENGGFYR